MRKTLQSNGLLDELPEGPMTRYVRDIYACSGSDLPFKEFQKQWEAKYEEDCRIRNIEHPIVFQREIRLDRYRTVSIFRRYKEDWHCSECNMAPNGGCGDIPLAEALSQSPSDVKAEVARIEEEAKKW